MDKPISHNSTSKKRRAGVSVVEVLVALFIFALFITGASKVLLVNRSMADLTREHYTAVNIAKNRTELARTFSYSALLDFEESETPVDFSGETIDENEARYRRTTAVATNGAVTEVTVTVEIRDHKTLGFDGTQEEIKTFIAYHP